jgi:hypothetical protein
MILFSVPSSSAVHRAPGGSRSAHTHNKPLKAALGAGFTGLLKIESSRKGKLIFSAQKHQGGRFKASPLSVAFGFVRTTTFSWRPSWWSSWLPSSLVSWLLSWLPFAYSPFSMGCIDSAN